MESTIPRLLREKARLYSSAAAQMYKDENQVFQPVTFEELYTRVCRLAAALKAEGVKRGELVGLISDNRPEWLTADIALHCLGAADVPRGCDSTAEDIVYILSFCRCRFAIIENALQLAKVLEMEDRLTALEVIIVLDPAFDPRSSPGGRFRIHRYEQLTDRGGQADFREIEAEIDRGRAEDTATIIFTSGTTGEPKGVMLSHGNFLHQVYHVPERITVNPGDRWLSVLPVWHSFERIMQYIALGSGSTLCYSKPVGSVMLADIQKVRPMWMVSVPRIWESIREGVYRRAEESGTVKKAVFEFFVAVGVAWAAASDGVRGLRPRFRRRPRALDFAAGILPFILLLPLRALGSALVFKALRDKLGGRFKAGISGGGALPAHVDSFFQAAGILLLEGYGLTESGPVLAVRSQNHPVPGTIGPAAPETEIRILDDKGRELPPGRAGILHARGGQIMQGYYRRDDLTSEAIDGEGWLNTGDIAVRTHDGEITIVGRAKDTIVLLGGENVEPAPIENRLKLSPYIAAAVVVGQDRRHLGALILPDSENTRRWADENGVSYTDEAELLGTPELQALISNEIFRLISAGAGFKLFEKIVRFTVLRERFEIGRELSAKGEIKRRAVNEIHERAVASLFDVD